MHAPNEHSRLCILANYINHVNESSVLTKEAKSAQNISKWHTLKNNKKGIKIQVGLGQDKRRKWIYGMCIT